MNRKERNDRKIGAEEFSYRLGFCRRLNYHKIFDHRRLFFRGALSKFGGKITKNKVKNTLI